MAAKPANIVAQECCKIGHLTFRVSVQDCGAITWALLVTDVGAHGGVAPVSKPIATGFVEDDLDGQFATAGRMVSLVRYGASGALT